ncbi:MAG: adenine deaminase C-terminal domain-containing protein, partial [Martelella sp.]
LYDLIETEIAPALHKRFRIRKNPESTGIMGSSLGGLAAFHMAWRYPNRFGLAAESGGLGGGRRAHLVRLDAPPQPINTWYGGELMVEDRKVTATLDEALSERWRYPDAAYHTVKLPKEVKLVPDLPAERVKAHCIRTELPGIMAVHEVIELEPANDWQSHFDRHGLCFVSVVERHGKSDGNVAHGLLSNFSLKRGAVASSVGHDSHNIIVAGTNEGDMQAALRAIEEKQGGVCVVADGKVRAMVELPIAGLLSDKRVHDVADAVRVLKLAWEEAGCAIPYMGFNLIPLSVIPEIRITDKGLVLVPEMEITELFEPA